MQDQLIAIATKPDGQKTVNARDLHAFLEVKSGFRHWIKNRITDFGFQEDTDFVRGGKNLPGLKSDYFLSIDMAKELSMVERNEKGKQARTYFIECEKAASSVSLVVPKSYAETLRQLADSVEETERLRLQVEQQAPAVEFVQKYVAASGLFGIRETAKIIGLQQNAFVTMCLENKVFFREGGSLQPFSNWIAEGYFEVKTGEANEHAFKQTRFTSKGWSGCGGT